MTLRGALAALKGEDLASSNMRALLEVLRMFDFRPRLEPKREFAGFGFALRLAGEPAFSGELRSGPTGLVFVKLELDGEPSPVSWSRDGQVTQDEDRKKLAKDFRRFLQFMGYKRKAAKAA